MYKVKFIFSTFALHFYFRQMRIVDTKGQLCPAPLIAAKKALKEAAIGESFIVLTDNQTSFNNLCRFLKDNSTEFQTIENGGEWTLTITKNQRAGARAEAEVKAEVEAEAEAEVKAEVEVEDYCNSAISHFEKGNFIIVFSSDKMGEGDEVLGHLLITSFIRALKDLDQLPDKIVFYNNGVKLVTMNSPVIEHLRDLEKMGVELLLCATCVAHYSIESVVGAGTVSNMYTIAELMTSAGKIIRP